MIKNKEFIKLQRRETSGGEEREDVETESVLVCGQCEGECEPSTAVLHTVGASHNQFCSEECFSQYRRKVYRAEQDQSPVNLSLSSTTHPSHSSQRPRLTVKPDHILKMSSRDRERQRSLRSSLDPRRGRRLRTVSPLATSSHAPPPRPPPPPPALPLPLLPPPTLLLPLPIFIPLPVPIPIPIPIKTDLDTSNSARPAQPPLTPDIKKEVEEEQEKEVGKVEVEKVVSPVGSQEESILSVALSDVSRQEERLRRKRRAFIMDQ